MLDFILEASKNTLTTFTHSTRTIESSMTETSSAQPETDRSQQRRNQVLEAAACCFRRKGFHGCSMAQLAKEAGMSVGHIYHYFANKEAIIDDFIKRDLDDTLQAIARLYESPDIFEDMVGCLEEPLELCMNLPTAALQFEILAEAARNPKVGDMVREAHLRVRDAVMTLIRIGSAKPISDELLEAKAEVIAAMFDGLTFKAIRDPHINHKALLKVMSSALRHILHY
jgi:AcrR family transcriptional regulator